MTPRRRRVLCGLGLLIPALALLFVSVFILLGGAGTQQCSSVPAQHSSCATDPVGAVLVTFPVGILCLVLSAAVFRGSRWVRWPAAVVGALLGTVTAAGSLAILVALAGDRQIAGAVLLGAGGAVLSLICALPVLLLSGSEGAEALHGSPRQRAGA
jgi:cytochrome bd-type quinol oxidase subunit 2